MKLVIELRIKWRFVPILHFLFPRARSPFPVPRFSNIATQNYASAVIIFNMPKENKGRRAGLKISGDELPVEKGLYKGCPLLPLFILSWHA